VRFDNKNEILVKLGWSRKPTFDFEFQNDKIIIALFYLLFWVNWIHFYNSFPNWKKIRLTNVMLLFFLLICCFILKPWCLVRWESRVRKIKNIWFVIFTYFKWDAKVDTGRERSQITNKWLDVKNKVFLDLIVVLMKHFNLI